MVLWGVSQKEMFKWLSGWAATLPWNINLCLNCFLKLPRPLKAAKDDDIETTRWRSCGAPVNIEGWTSSRTAVLQLQGNNADTIHVTLGWTGNILHLRTFWSQMRKEKPNNWLSNISIYWRISIKIGQSFQWYIIVYPSKSGMFLLYFFFID